MKFFIPDVDDPELAEKTYQSIVQFVPSTLGWDVTDRRILRITYRHHSESYEAEVGKINPTNNELVIAILDSNAYLICTPTRGVLQGIPMLVGKEETYSVEEFES